MSPASPLRPLRQTQSVDAALVSRGEYVARLSDCVACHSLPGKAPFAGGLEMATPLGAIHATNITPDRDNGIGNYSPGRLRPRSAPWRDAGRGAGSTRRCPTRPDVKLSDDDIRALYAFSWQVCNRPTCRTSPATFPGR